MTVLTASPLTGPGGRIDEALDKTPVRIAVLTVSDTRDEESDTSGHVLAERVKAAGHELAAEALRATLGKRTHGPDERIPGAVVLRASTPVRA